MVAPMKKLGLLRARSAEVEAGSAQDRAKIKKSKA
jgi:hypothetical protein